MDSPGALQRCIRASRFFPLQSPCTKVVQAKQSKAHAGFPPLGLGSGLVPFPNPSQVEWMFLTFCRSTTHPCLVNRTAQSAFDSLVYHAVCTTGCTGRLNLCTLGFSPPLHLGFGSILLYRISFLSRFVVV